MIWLFVTYKFEKVIGSNKFNNEDAIENIDIGGASMLRAAAKNYNDVVVVSDPSDYEFVFNCILENKLNYDTEKSTEVFNLLSDYDIKIANIYQIIKI